MRIVKVFAFFLVVLALVGGASAQVPLRTVFFFPQIADGDLDEEDEFRTLLILNNPSDAEATGTLSIFAQDGSPLEMRFVAFASPVVEAGEILIAEEGELDFTLPAQGLLQIITAPLEDGLVVAYGKVESDTPMSGMAIFGRFKVKEEEDKFEVEIESQAAVEATGTMQEFAVIDFRMNKFKSETEDFEFEFESSTKTGIAIVNTGSEATTLRLTEFSPSGEEIGEAEITLAAGEHRAFFFDEELEVPEGTVIGTVIVSSSTPNVSAVALKFDSEADASGKIENEFTVAPVTQLAP